MRKPKPTEEKLKLETQRLDKWLWAARFYKTRRLAAEAISGGKVHINGNRAKPSKDIKTLDKLSISKNTYLWDITILGINAQRRPAKEAVLLYQEDEASLQRRLEQIAFKKASELSHPRAERPNKKQRRQIHRFKYSD